MGLHTLISTRRFMAYNLVRFCGSSARLSGRGTVCFVGPFALPGIRHGREKLCDGHLVSECTAQGLLRVTRSAVCFQNHAGGTSKQMFFHKLSKSATQIPGNAL